MYIHENVNHNSKIKAALVLILFTFLLMVSLANATPTYEKAQHRLPPVIYSLDMPKTVISGQNYKFNWTVMGYHDSYHLTINIYDEQGNIIANDYVSPNRVTDGQYSWGNIQSRLFHYSTNLNFQFTNYQKLTVRFFASPVNDPVDTTSLSAIIPGGLGYQAADTTGRKINIFGLPYNGFLIDFLDIYDRRGGVIDDENFKTDSVYISFADAANFHIKPTERGSKIVFTFLPGTYTEKDFIYKFVLPWNANVSAITNNGLPLNKNSSSTSISAISEELAGEMFGTLGSALKVAFPGGIPAAGDGSSFLTYGGLDIIKRTHYPYQMLQGVFREAAAGVSSQLIIEFNVSMGELLNTLSENKMSFYVGSEGYEILVEGLTTK